MDKKTFYVITIEENGKRFSYADTIRNCNNLVGIFPKNAVTINACDSRTKAEKIALDWNEDWKMQGRFSYEVNRKY